MIKTINQLETTQMRRYQKHYSVWNKCSVLDQKINEQQYMFIYKW